MAFLPPYHMAAESRPLYLLLRLILAPLRLRRWSHADPLLTGASFVVYICVPIANYTVASSLAAQDQPTHHYHMMVESRSLYLRNHVMNFEGFCIFDYWFIRLLTVVLFLHYCRPFNTLLLVRITSTIFFAS